MRVFQLSLAILALLAVPRAALAADVVTELPPQPIEAPAPISIWSGPYAGAFIGYSSTNFDQSTGADYDGGGIVGGAYGGYNFQTGPVVYGVEGDLGYSGFDATGIDGRADLPVKAESNVFGSLRARAGVAYDPFLFFATGGVALADKELRVGDEEDDNTHVGYTVGAGVEAQVTPSLTSRLEYRYSDFNSKTYDLGPTTTSTGFDEHSVRAGLALKF